MPDDRSDGELNWPWLIGCCVIGLCLIGLALGLQTAFKWVGVVPDTLVEAGVGTVIIGIAFLFERRFARKVTRAAAEAAEASFARQAGQMQARIDQLTEAVRDREREDARSDDEVISGLEYPDFVNIVRALSAAYTLNALATPWLKVTASGDRDLLSLRFSTVREQDRYYVQILVTPEKNAKTHPTSQTIILWSRDETTVDVGRKIILEIQRRGLVDDLDGFDWSAALANLRKSLDVAVRSRRRDSDAWRLDGKLYELLGDDWAVTSSGLEHRPPPDFKLPAESFYRHYVPWREQRSERLIESQLLGKRPPWCSEVDWEWLTARAQAHY